MRVMLDSSLDKTVYAILFGKLDENQGRKVERLRYSTTPVWLQLFHGNVPEQFAAFFYCPNSVAVLIFARGTTYIRMR
mgnify:CR=1 FL=1